MAPSTFDRYVGRYQLAPAAIVTISRDGSRFLAQLTGQPVFDIYAENDTKFFFKIVDAQLTFETDAQGKAQAVVLHQNGANQRAPRIEGDRLPQRRSRWPPASSIDTSGGISSFRASSSASAGREQD